MIAVGIVGVAVFMSGPVYYGTLDGSHEEMQGQEQPHPPLGGEDHVKRDVGRGEEVAGDGALGHFLHSRPGGDIFIEAGLGLHVVVHQGGIVIFGMPDHLERIAEIKGRMRVLFGIAVGVVHAVHDGIRAGVQVGRTLGKPGKNPEELFPERGHSEHLMSAVTVVEERLGK